jgi:alpha-D-xyloside xylohydrolase
MQSFLPLGLVSASHSPIVRHYREDRSIILVGAEGERTRITPYGSFIVRVQAVRAGEGFFPDDRYEMVESHRWPGTLRVTEDQTSIRIGLSEEPPGPVPGEVIDPASDPGIVVLVDRSTARLAFAHIRAASARPDDAPPITRGSAPNLADVLTLLQESQSVSWETQTVRVSFRHDPGEHFTGLGHGYLGREAGLDLRGKIVARNYGTEHGQQAPLIVPFYLSSKGYGLFLNSTFPNTFNFGKDGYTISLAGPGRMDYFVILGPEFSRIIERYTRLTGRPRFPPRAVFGLALSDKSHERTSPVPAGENWWKRQVSDHRNAGFPLDHIVNDNQWRAGGGKRCESRFAWDSSRYPDPVEYAEWIRENNLFVTLDLNRCIAARSEGWQAGFNIPETGGIAFGESAPDFTRKEVRQWFWSLFWKKSLDPALGYPGDALWIDEFDEMGSAPLSMRFGDGRTWQEMRNYWFFLIAKSLVQEGWDRDIGTGRRPFVWVRGMTAGAQRYATLWSGDIKPNYEDMKSQVRSMQLAGLSGFPYWGHDAGGFHDWEMQQGPNDTLYRKWSMAFGSFSPFWKPHGMGQSRWPLDRSAAAREDAKIYCALRYALMPYTYTIAHEAAVTGMPMARAMVIEHQRDSLAWTSDLQFMWGPSILVAPDCFANDTVQVWLPGGMWYDYWTNARMAGERIFPWSSQLGRLPLFVREGSIIPMAPPGLSAARNPGDSLRIHVYTGKDASFTLYADDGISEGYRVSGEFQTTDISFRQAGLSLAISPAVGRYRGVPDRRTYRVDFHGLAAQQRFEVNGVRLKDYPNEAVAIAGGEGAAWNGSVQSVFVDSRPVNAPVIIRAAP